MTPLMLLLGFPPQVVLASSKAGGLGLNIGALSKFTRKKGIIDWRWGAFLSVLAIIASLLGTQLVFVLSGETLKRPIIVVTLLLVPVMFFERSIGLKHKTVSKTRRWIGIATYSLIMALQAGLGSGTGVLLMFVLMGLFGFDALHASATKHVPGLILVGTSFIIFAFSGYMNWTLAFALGLGTLLGGYIGASQALKQGNKLVKNALLIIAAVMAVGVLFD